MRAHDARAHRGTASAKLDPIQNLQLVEHSYAAFDSSARCMLGFAYRITPVQSSAIITAPSTNRYQMKTRVVCVFR